MASIAHLAAGALCGAIYSRSTHTRRLTTIPMFAALAMVPDLDFIALELGSDGTPLEHRVLTHSLAFAAVVGGIAGSAAAERGRKVAAAALCVAALASHGLLDALTNNEPGPQLFWPFVAQPIHFAWGPIPGTQAYQEYFTLEVVPILAAEALLSVAVFAAAAWIWLSGRPGVQGATGGAENEDGAPRGIE